MLHDTKSQLHIFKFNRVIVLNVHLILVYKVNEYTYGETHPQLKGIIFTFLNQIREIKQQLYKLHRIGSRVRTRLPW